MNRTENRQEYASRINKVIDYIDENLDKELRLVHLAKVASFSPYHFHRVFKAFMGEPLGQYITRLRVQKAATQLNHNPNKSVTEVALDCGFSGSAAFARAFRDRFGMSATKWRQSGGELNGKIRKTDSKIGQLLGKPRKEFTVTTRYDGTQGWQTTWRVTMSEDEKKTLETKVEIQELPDWHIAYVRHIGPYQGNDALFGELFGKLFGWAGPRGLLGADTTCLSVYYDEPDITDEDNLRLTIGLTVGENTPVDGEVGKTHLPGGRYAVGRFELRPDQYSDAWDAMFKGWLPESGYQPDDRPSLELYRNDPNEHPEGLHIVDICIPVKPLD